MPALTDQQKLFVVEHLGTYHTLSEVAERLQTVFQVTATLQQLQRYDPTTAAGVTLRADLKKLFYRARETFVSSQETIAIAHKSWRLAELQKLFERYKTKAPVIAARMLEQAAKEAGGVYARREEEQDDGVDLPEVLDQAVTKVYGDATAE
jgi:hypothetical protein